MKNIIFNFILASAAAIAASLPVQAQEYAPIPADLCDQIVDVVCYERVEGQQLIWVIPQRQDENYVLTAQPIGIYTLMVLIDRETLEPVSYMLLDDDAQMISRYRGKSGYGGDLEFLEQFAPEIVDLLSVIPW
jgi:hypothetical protein